MTLPSIGEAVVSDVPFRVINEQIKGNTPADILVSDRDFNIFQWVFATFLCQGIDIFGIVTNTINIVCFVKQGFKDPVNVSLLGLAVSDLCSLVTLLWTTICLTPALSTADVPFIPIETQYLIGGIPHTAFARITGWITALITLERCLCVTLPLKVKDIIKPRRVSVIITCVFVAHIFSLTPIYVVNRLEMKWTPEKNRTLLGLVFSENRESVEKISFMVNGVFTSFTAFIVIIVCTLILVFKLHSNTKWRKTSINYHTDNVSIHNVKVAKMVVIISLLFITCFIPIIISYLAMSLIPGFSIEGRHRNILLIFGILGVVLESINSSVNIFIYYHMSSNYREIFHRLFSMGK